MRLRGCLAAKKAPLWFSISEEASWLGCSRRLSSGSEAAESRSRLCSTKEVWRVRSTTKAKSRSSSVLLTKSTSGVIRGTEKRSLRRRGLSTKRCRIIQSTLAKSAGTGRLTKACTSDANRVSNIGERTVWFVCWLRLLPSFELSNFILELILLLTSIFVLSSRYRFVILHWLAFSVIEFQHLNRRPLEILMSPDRLKVQFLRSVARSVTFIIFFKMLKLLPNRGNLLRDGTRVIESLLLSTTEGTHSHLLLGCGTKLGNVIVCCRLTEKATNLRLFRFLLPE